MFRPGEILITMFEDGTCVANINDFDGDTQITTEEEPSLKVLFASILKMTKVTPVELFEAD